MSRDYKPSAAKAKPASKGSPFLSGFLVGLLVGVALAVGVVIAIQSSDKPFTNNVDPAASIENNHVSDAAVETDNSVLAKDEVPNPEVIDDGKPRFDFYTILPGSETQVTEQEISQQKAAVEAKVVNESYFLQVGAFKNEQDADNQKAQLALLGIEAIVQTAEIPEKGVWHRVRVGPFSNLAQINNARTQLVENGFNVDLLKVKTKQERP